MGVTVQQAQTAMANLLARAAAESWVPNKFLPTLSYMGAETIEKLKNSGPTVFPMVEISVEYHLKKCKKYMLSNRC